jgi:DNA-directed RNA polymerase subunit RPC12/RpoP
MKPYLFNYRCPHCQKSLQSQNTESGHTVPCPGCAKPFVVPPPPPRPLGGWLTAYGVVQVLVLSLFLVTFAFVPLAILMTPFMIPGLILLYGFFKQRRWFVPCVLYAQVFNFLMGVSVLLLEAQTTEPAVAWARLGVTWIISITFLLYFWRSKRVKETFTA